MRAALKLLRYTTFGIVLCLLCLQVFGGDSSTKDLLENVKKERRRIESELSKLLSKEEKEDGSSSEKHVDHGSELSALDAVFAQQESKLSELLDLTGKLQEAKLLVEKAEHFEPDEKKPYSFLTMESLRDLSEKELLNENSLTIELKSAKQRVEFANADLVEKQKEHNQSPSKKNPSSESSSASLDLTLELAKQRATLRKTETEVLKNQLEICDLTLKQLKAKIAVYEKGAKFLAEDREAKILELKAAESAFQLQKTNAERHVDKLIALLSRLKFEAADTSADESTLKVVEKEVALCQSIALHSVQVAECLADAQLHWKHRFELKNAGKNKIPNLKDWKSNLDDLLERIDANLLAIHRKQESNQSRTAPLPTELKDDAGKKSDAEYLVVTQQFADSANVKSLNQLESLKLPMARFQRELKEIISKTSASWSSNPFELLAGILSYELVEVDDEGIPVSRALQLILLIAIGIYGSILVSKVTARFLFPYFGVKPGVAVALRSIVRYTLCIVFGIVAFKLMGIPLTAFAFLGGAAAIAVGFGSQDVMNNFMSGVILLTEQPIRVGDVILLSESQCIVTHIGLRSTRLRNYQNHELIVPNTLLIEKLVTNLTLSDNLLRLVVPLVVDRTEPVRESMELILQALKKESRIHQAMEPIVLLKEVDTYYLTFEVHFTIEFADPMESLVAQSKILAVIGQLFPTKASSPANAEESQASADSQGADTSAGEEPGKMTRDQLEKQIKRLQSFLIKKK